MRIARLEFGLVRGDWDWEASEYNCFCKNLSLGPIFFTWLSYECMAGMYNDKARLYRIRRYLKVRRKRANKA